MLEAEADRTQQTQVAQITMQRDQKLAALDQTFMQQKIALEQQKTQTIAGIEQQAMQVGAQAQQARLQAEMRTQYGGYGAMPYGVPDESVLSEQKERQIAAVTE